MVFRFSSFIAQQRDVYLSSNRYIESEFTSEILLSSICIIKNNLEMQSPQSRLFLVSYVYLYLLLYK